MNISLVVGSSMLFNADEVCLGSHAVRKLSASCSGCFILGVTVVLTVIVVFMQR